MKRFIVAAACAGAALVISPAAQAPLDKALVEKPDASFTAVMLLQLVERGVVKLTDPVEKYLPEINRLSDRPKAAAPVTLGLTLGDNSQLHNSQLPNELSSRGPDGEWRSRLNPRQPQMAALD